MNTFSLTFTDEQIVALAGEGCGDLFSVEDARRALATYLETIDEFVFEEDGFCPARHEAFEKEFGENNFRDAKGNFRVWSSIGSQMVSRLHEVVLEGLKK
jgi:hypothetical protein